MKPIYITKKDEPLVVDDFALCPPSYVRRKYKVDPSQWQVYQYHKDHFLRLQEKMNKDLIETGYCSRQDWDAYQRAKTAFMLSHLALNGQFSKEAE